MTLRQQFDRLDRRITAWMAHFGITLTRLSLGLIFVWFGVLKFFPGASPAGELASRTIERVSFGQLSPPTGLFILAGWEVLIGVGLLLGRFLRITLLLLFIQMAGTLLPLFFYPSETFQRFPLSPTLEGQYIIKNLVLMAAALVVGSTVRGGYVLSQPTGGRKRVT
ncbi:MAG TPA: DoxX family membrane protein [Gemmatimonadales bacterium]|jgi:uncharacterized membrane protein YphA (DoxX/SURF4 family)|nr:DoxX family membrane protein [Gemmatimonadales bacterium]